MVENHNIFCNIQDPVFNKKKTNSRYRDSEYKDNDVVKSSCDTPYEQLR